MLTPEDVRKLNAIRQGKTLYSVQDIENAIDKVLAAGEDKFRYSDHFDHEIPYQRRNLVEAMYKEKGWKLSYARDNGDTVYFSF